jgi:hypothetical protein
MGGLGRLRSHYPYSARRLESGVACFGGGSLIGLGGGASEGQRPAFGRAVCRWCGSEAPENLFEKV